MLLPWGVLELRWLEGEGLLGVACKYQSRPSRLHQVLGVGSGGELPSQK